MTISTPRYGKILLGRQGENLATKVIIQINQIKTGDGYPVLVHQRAKDTEPYPVAVTEDGDAIEWIVTSADTEYAGYGKAEVRWMGANGEIVKSVTYQTYTEKSMTEPSEPPEVWEGYIGQVAENAHIAQVAANDAEQAASATAESAQVAVSAANKAADSAQKAKDSCNQVLAALPSKISEPEKEGTNGQVLVTNGNGGRHWENPGTSFTTDETLTLKEGVLSVNRALSAEQDNTLPITSAAVAATVGNIEILLKTI